MKPTRITTHSATLIDHIYTNKKELTSTSGILITDLADHFGIFSIIENKKIQKNEEATKTFRSLSPENILKFNELLQDTDFTLINETMDPEIAYQLFIELYLIAFDKAFPLKTIKILRKYSKRSSWMTSDLLKMSIERQKLFRRKLRTPSDENIHNYKNFTKTHNKLLKNARKSYFMNQLEESKFDIKKTWSILRIATNTMKAKPSLPDFFTINNTKMYNKQEIANKFNHYFATIGSEMSKNVPATDIPYTQYLKQPHKKSIYFSPITYHDILDIVAKLKNKTSQGHDGISTKLVKSSITHIATPLTHIFNQSLCTGKVPDSLKIAKVIPIFKSGDSHSFNNYRPISILPAFSKILEKMVATKLVNFLESENLLYEHQYGFRPGHNTIQPIVQLLNHITNANDKATKDLTLSVFVDLSKAFDTLDHNILLQKLSNLGVRGIANQWFKSYLSNRRQFLEFKTFKSGEEILNCSVPQGSILGPILFLIYVNDICNCTDLALLSYADDTTITYSHHDLPSLYNKINEELKKLDTWFSANRLCLNVKKTKYILFRPGNIRIENPNLKIEINHEPIDRISHTGDETSFKFLGLHIDETLSWKYHAQKLCAKISRSNYIINKSKNVISSAGLHTLYSTLVQSHINYGSIIWGKCSSSNKVHKLQKRAIRIIHNKPYNSHTEPLFKKSGILKLDDQVNVNTLLFMHQLKHDKLPKSFKNMDYFHKAPVEGRAITRQNKLAHCYRYRTTFTAKLPFHCFPRTWNELESEKQNIPTINAFKRALKKIILDSYSKFVKCYHTGCPQCS